MLDPAEFRTLREGLHLSEKDISMLTLVKESQIKAWEAGADPVPEGTSGLIMDIDREIERRIEKARQLVADKADITLIRFPNPIAFKRAGPDMAPIPAFLAYKCHCALIVRLRIALMALGKAVKVRYHHPKAGVR
jgi:hypothetical protein